MIVEINSKRYKLPKDILITIVCLNGTKIRVCFHWHEEHRSGIDIDSFGMGMFEGKSGIIHTIHCVTEDAEEFDNWYKSMR